MKLELRWEIAGQAPQSVELIDSRMIIGTLLSNHVVLRAPEVEPIHAIIESDEMNPDRWLIVDLGSESGVFVNGTRVDVEKELSLGDTIKIGTAEVTFAEASQEEEEAVGAPPPPPPTLAKDSAQTAQTVQSEQPRTAQSDTEDYTPSYGDTKKEESPSQTVRQSNRETKSERRVEKKDLLFSPRKAKPSGDYLECVAYWADTVLDVDLFHANKKKTNDFVSIGDPTVADFIAGGSENVKMHVLAKVKDGGYKVYLRKGMEARIRKGGKVDSAKDSGSVSLGRRDIIHIKYGAVRYFLLFVRPPSLNLPRRTIKDPFFFGLSLVAALFYLTLLPVIVFSDPPKEKTDKDDIYSIVYVPEKLKKPEPIPKPKPEPKPKVPKVAEVKKPPPKPKTPPPPKPKPVKPAEPKKVKVVKQPKPTKNPQKVNQKKPGVNVAKKTPKKPQKTPQKTPKPPSPDKKLNNLGKSGKGMIKTDRKADFRIPGPKNKAKLGKAGGPRGGGNKKAGAQRKGKQNYSVMGVSDGKVKAPSGRNLSKLGVGVGKVLSKTGPSAQYTDFKSSKGGLGRGAGSGRKTVGLGGSGKRGSLGLGGTSGGAQNFGQGYGGAGSGLGGSGGLGGNGLSGRGIGNGTGKGGGRSRPVVNVPGIAGVSGGGLTQQEILDVIKAHLNQIRHCYDRLLQRSPNARGKIKVKWKIGTNGRVTTTSIVSSSISDSTMKGCVTSRIKRWKFPKPRNNKPVDVSFPFSFVSNG